MAVTLVLELTMTVANDEQASKVIEAVANGLAEAAIKDRILYGGVSDKEAKSHNVDAAEKKAAEQKIELKPIDMAPVEKPKVVEEKVEKPARPKGVLGERRIGRLGRK